MKDEALQGEAPGTASKRARRAANEERAILPKGRVRFARAWSGLAAAALLVSACGGKGSPEKVSDLFTLTPGPEGYTLTSLRELGGIEVEAHDAIGVLYRFDHPPTFGANETFQMENKGKIPTTNFPRPQGSPVLEFDLYLAAVFSSGEISAAERFHYTIDLPPAISFSPPPGGYLGRVDARLSCNEPCSIAVSATPEGGEPGVTEGRDEVAVPVGASTELMALAADDGGQIKQVSVQYTIGRHIDFNPSAQGCAVKTDPQDPRLREIVCPQLPVVLEVTTTAESMEYSTDGLEFSTWPGRITVEKSLLIAFRAKSGESTTEFQVLLTKKSTKELIFTPPPGAYNADVPFEVRVTPVPSEEVLVTVIRDRKAGDAVNCTLCVVTFEEPGIYTIQVVRGIEIVSASYRVDKEAPKITLDPPEKKEPYVLESDTERLVLTVLLAEEGRVTAQCCHAEGQCHPFDKAKKIGLGTGDWSCLLRGIDSAGNLSDVLNARYTIVRKQTILTASLEMDAVKNAYVRGAIFAKPGALEATAVPKGKRIVPAVENMEGARFHVGGGCVASEKGRVCPGVGSEAVACDAFAFGDAPACASGTKITYGYVGREITLSWNAAVDDIAVSESGDIAILSADSVCICSPPYDCSVNTPPAGSTFAGLTGGAWTQVTSKDSNSTVTGKKSLVCKSSSGGTRLIGFFPDGDATPASDPLLDTTSNLIFASVSGGTITLGGVPADPITGEYVEGTVSLPDVVIGYRKDGIVRVRVHRNRAKTPYLDVPIPSDPVGVVNLGNALLVCSARDVSLVAPDSTRVVYVSSAEIRGCGINSRGEFFLLRGAAGGTETAELLDLVDGGKLAGVEREIATGSLTSLKFLTAKDAVAVGAGSTATGLVGYSTDAMGSGGETSALGVLVSQLQADVDPGAGSTKKGFPTLGAGGGLIHGYTTTSTGIRPVAVGYGESYVASHLVFPTSNEATGILKPGGTDGTNIKVTNLDTTDLNRVVTSTTPASTAAANPMAFSGVPGIGGVPVVFVNADGANPYCDTWLNGADWAVAPCLLSAFDADATAGLGSADFAFLTGPNNAAVGATGPSNAPHQSWWSSRYASYGLHTKAVGTCATTEVTTMYVVPNSWGLNGFTLSNAKAGATPPCLQTKSTTTDLSPVADLSVQAELILVGLGSGGRTAQIADPFFKSPRAIAAPGEATRPSAGGSGGFLFTASDKGKVVTFSDEWEVALPECAPHPAAAAETCVGAYSWPFLYVGVPGSTGGKIRVYRLFDVKPPGLAGDVSAEWTQTMDTLTYYVELTSKGKLSAAPKGGALTGAAKGVSFQPTTEVVFSYELDPGVTYADSIEILTKEVSDAVAIEE